MLVLFETPAGYALFKVKTFGLVIGRHACWTSGSRMILCTEGVVLFCLNTEIAKSLLYLTRYSIAKL